jgi:hypothetical protein
MRGRNQPSRASIHSSDKNLVNYATLCRLSFAVVRPHAQRANVFTIDGVEHDQIYGSGNELQRQ